MDQGNHFRRLGRRAFEALRCVLSDQWTIYLEPRVADASRMRADVLCLHPLEGVVLVEAKAWKLRDDTRSRYERDSTADHTGVIQFRPTPNATPKDVRDPYTQLDQYAARLRERISQVTNRTHVPLRGIAWFTDAPLAHVRGLYGEHFDNVQHQLHIQIRTFTLEDVECETTALDDVFFAHRPGTAITRPWDNESLATLEAVLQKRSWESAHGAGPALPDGFVAPRDRAVHAYCPSCLHHDELWPANGLGRGWHECRRCESTFQPARRCADCGDQAFLLHVPVAARPGRGTDTWSHERRLTCSSCGWSSVSTAA